MRLIIKQTDYAIRAVLAMARDIDKKFTATDLSKNLKIPKPFIRGILQKLNKEKIVKSFKGKGGGFKLEIPPEKLKVIRLIQVFQGPVKVDHCFIRNEICPDFNTCPLRVKLLEISKYINNEFESLTIQELIYKQN